MERVLNLKLSLSRDEIRQLILDHFRKTNVVPPVVAEDIKFKLTDKGCVLEWMESGEQNMPSVERKLGPRGPMTAEQKAKISASQRLRHRESQKTAVHD